MVDETVVETLYEEFGRIRKYLYRKEELLKFLINCFDSPDSEEFWKAREALMETQRYFTKITDCYNCMVDALNVEYHKRQSEK